jgi:hypothetical protein
MTSLGLVRHNVLRRPLRAVVTSLAVAIGVMAVLALGVLTYSLRQTAVSVLKTGNADFDHGRLRSGCSHTARCYGTRRA